MACLVVAEVAGWVEVATAALAREAGARVVVDLVEEAEAKVVGVTAAASLAAAAVAAMVEGPKAVAAEAAAGWAEGKLGSVVAVIPVVEALVVEGPEVVASAAARWAAGGAAAAFQ